VVAAVAPTSAVTWTLYRDISATRSTVFVDNDPLPAASLNGDLDKLTLIAQRIREISERAIRQPEGDANTIGRMPALAARKNMALGFDANGGPTAIVPTTGGLSAVSSYVNGLLNASNAVNFKLFQNLILGGTTGGSANAQTLSPGASYTAYST